MTVESRSPSRLLAYMQLCRLPNVFTAMADLAMGFLFTHASLAPLSEFTFLLISSSMLYMGGMVLNDLLDFEVDRRERPHRPLPSGRVLQTEAKRLGFALLSVGVAAGWSASWWAGDWRPGAVATALVAVVVLYDRLLKRIAFGEVAMGACRMLNVLLGMSVSPQPWTTANWIVAGGVGMYIVGVTRLARSEAAVSGRFELANGLVVMLAGMITLWWFPTLVPVDRLTGLLRFQPWNWTLLWILLAAVIGARCLWAIRRPEPARVQAAVKSSILLLVVLDAVVVFAVRGPEAMLGVLLLLVPTIILGRWVYST